MTKNHDELLNTLMGLATDLGYTVETESLRGVSARSIEVEGGRVLQIDDVDSIENRIQWVARCLQNDPQLAWFDLTNRQEQALQLGSELANSAVESHPMTQDSTLHWPSATPQRKAS